jgi:hypothetical protein
VRDRLIGILQEIGPLAYFPPKLAWRNASHRNSIEFDRINSCVSKSLIWKIHEELNHMKFLYFSSIPRETWKQESCGLQFCRHLAKAPSPHPDWPRWPRNKTYSNLANQHQRCWNRNTGCCNLRPQPKTSHSSHQRTKLSAAASRKCNHLRAGNTNHREISNTIARSSNINQMVARNSPKHERVKSRRCWRKPGATEELMPST